MTPRLSIALFLAVFSLVLLCTFGFLSRQLLFTSLTEIQDNQLRELAAYLKTEIVIEDGKPVLKLDEEEDPIAATRGATIQLFDQQRTLVFQYGKSAPVSLQTGISDQEVSNHVVRVLATHLNNGAWLQIAMSEAEKQRALDAYNSMLKIFLPSALLLVCVSSYLFSGFVLRPIEASLQGLREFMAEAGHELRTPTTIVLTNVQALQLDVAENTFEPRRLDAAERAALRMKGLVENLLLLAKSENAKIAFHMNKMDLTSITRDVVQNYKEAFASKGVALSFDGGTASVRGDREALARAIENLVENALQYTAGGGAVAVTVSQEKGYAQVRVSDTGIGIPRELHEKVFHQFVRVDESRDRHSGGAGLGLSIVKSIVEAHGGRVWVQSEPNKGSKFFLEIPSAS